MSTKMGGKRQKKQQQLELSLPSGGKGILEQLPLEASSSSAKSEDGKKRAISIFQVSLRFWVKASSENK